MFELRQSSDEKLGSRTAPSSLITRGGAGGGNSWEEDEEGKGDLDSLRVRDNLVLIAVEDDSGDVNLRRLAQVVELIPDQPWEQAQAEADDRERGLKPLSACSSWGKLRQPWPWRGWRRREKSAARLLQALCGRDEEEAGKDASYLDASSTATPLPTDWPTRIVRSLGMLRPAADWRYSTS
eukprot:566166-Hanusia_phi.AAC.2